MHKFIIQLHVLQWLFVRGLMRNKGRVKLFQVLQKERFFHLLRQASALRGNLIMWLSRTPSHILSSSVWPRREYTWTLN